MGGVTVPRPTFVVSVLFSPDPPSIPPFRPKRVSKKGGLSVSDCQIRPQPFPLPPTVTQTPVVSSPYKMRTPLVLPSPFPPPFRPPSPSLLPRVRPPPTDLSSLRTLRPLFRYPGLLLTLSLSDISPGCRKSGSVRQDQ